MYLPISQDKEGRLEGRRINYIYIPSPTSVIIDILPIGDFHLIFSSISSYTEIPHNIFLDYNMYWVVYIYVS